MENVEKQKNTKIVIVSAAVVLLLLAILAFFLWNREEAYRSIQVYKVEGTVDVERPQVGILEAYANMMLQTLDIVNVSDNSNLQVKLDEDKYILLEPNTRIRLEAAGNSTDSKTKIYVEQGSIVCNIENKLSANSTYEVSTPNSTMAVRGTTFRVAVSFDEEGNSYTAVAVYEGAVDSRLIYPDGTVSEEHVSIPAGTQTQIKGTVEDTIFVVTGEDIPYEELEEITLDFLEELIDKGTDLPISKEELQELVISLSDKQNTTPGDTKPVTEETLANTQQTPAEGENTQKQEDSSQKEEVLAGEGSPNKGDSAQGENGSNEGEGAQGEDSPNEGEGSQGEDSPNEGEGSQGEDSPNEGDDSSEEDTGEETPAQYTVTFTYNGKVFGQQTVVEGECAGKPVLLPTRTGYWDYDFSTQVTRDTTVAWVDTTGQS